MLADMRALRTAMILLAVTAGLAACGDDGDPTGSDPTETDGGSTGATDTTSAVGGDPSGSAGNCLANGTVTGDVEATLEDADASSAFVGDEGSYLVRITDDETLGLLYTAGLDVNASITDTAGDLFLRGGPDGIDLATDGSGGTIDAEFTGQTGTASVRIEISCG